MKKLAIGCGILLVIAAAAGGFGAYWIYSQARQYVSSFAEFGKAAELDKQVTNQSSFTPPPGGELTPAQVERFISLQQRMRADLGARFEEMKLRYERLDSQRRAEDRAPTLSEGLAALKDLTGMVLDVKKVHVAALNEQGMSMDEYRWLRDQVYAAAGLPFTSFHLSALVEAAQSGDTAKMTDALTGNADTLSAEVPPANRALVAPHREQLKEWIALAWLAL
jgi:hypothetical protein